VWEGRSGQNVAHFLFPRARVDAEINAVIHENAVFLLYHFIRPTPLGKRHSSPFGGGVMMMRVVRFLRRRDQQTRHALRMLYVA
jgi:hypothetical protein